MSTKKVSAHLIFVSVYFCFIYTLSFLTGFEHNFNKYDDTFITDQNTPYDYESVMHYSIFAFGKDPNKPTITAKDPDMNKLIGQYNDFSDTDLLRLNKMYNCCKYTL